MSTNANDLVLTEGLIQSDNPLRVVGLDALILRLGLKRPDIHQVVLRYARELSIVTHTDKGGDPELARRYSQAYEDLQDETKFRAALNELRAEANEEKRLSKGIDSTAQTTILQLQKQLQSLQQGGSEVYGLPGVRRLSELSESLRTFVLAQGLRLTFQTQGETGFTTASVNRVVEVEVCTLHFSAAQRKPKAKPGTCILSRKNFLVAEPKEVISWKEVREALGNIGDAVIEDIQRIVGRYAESKSWVILSRRRIKLDQGFFTDPIGGRENYILGSLKLNHLGLAGAHANELLDVSLSDLALVLNPFLERHSLLVIDSGTEQHDLVFESLDGELKGADRIVEVLGDPKASKEQQELSLGVLTDLAMEQVDREVAAGTYKLSDPADQLTKILADKMANTDVMDVHPGASVGNRSSVIHVYGIILSIA